MTELDLYLQRIPMIAELVVSFQNLSDQQHKDWKRKTMEAAPHTVKEFLGKEKNRGYHRNESKCGRL